MTVKTHAKPKRIVKLVLPVKSELQDVLAVSLRFSMGL
jgi:hypothetical protein